MKNFGGCDLVKRICFAMDNFKIHEKLTNVHDWT
jgi:hypothetical protein